MKPLILHNLAGEEVRFNPMQIIAWRTQTHVGQGEGAPTIYGGMVVVLDGPKPVLETAPVIDILFEAATESVLIQSHERPGTPRRRGRAAKESLPLDGA